MVNNWYNISYVFLYLGVHMSLPTILSSTALRTNQPAVREAARERPVYITDNGGPSYVFCSEEWFDAKEHDAEEQAAYAARVSRVIERGRSNIAAGKCVEGLDAARDYVRQARANRG